MRDFISLPTTVVIDGRRYRVRPTVRRVMLASRVRDLDDILDIDKARLYVRLLYRFPRPRNLAAAIRAVDDLLAVEQKYRAPAHGTVIDFEQDAEMICAAFRQQYGIDLPRESDRMDWRYFNALLGGISSDTTLGYIMDIRGKKIPRRTKSNGEYCTELAKAKAIYAIQGSKTSFRDGLAKMAEILASMAGEKNG